MSTAHAEAERLIERSKRAGWELRPSSGGRQVVVAPSGRCGDDSCPCKISIGYRISHGIKSWMRRHGLEDDLAKAAAAEAEARAAALEADRARVQLSHHGGSDKQPGQQQTELLVVDPPVSVSVHPVSDRVVNEGVPMARKPQNPEMYTETIMVDRSWADEHLDIPLPKTGDTQLRQRRRDDALIEHYEGIIERGEWFLSPEGVALGPKNCVLDGQHRLWAISNMDAKLPMRVTYNCDPAVFLVLNTGKRRTGPDVLYMAGETNTTQLNSALKLLWCYDMFMDNPDGVPHWKDWNRIRPSNNQLHSILHSHPDMREAMKAIAHVHRRILCTHSSLAVFWYVAQREWPSQRGLKKFETFWHQLTTGAGVEELDPALTLRNWLVTHSREAMYARRERLLLALLRAWNAFCEERQLEAIKVPYAWGMIRPYRPPTRGPAAGRE